MNNLETWGFNSSTKKIVCAKLTRNVMRAMYTDNGDIPYKEESCLDSMLSKECERRPLQSWIEAS